MEFSILIFTLVFVIRCFDEYLVVNRYSGSGCNYTKTNYYKFTPVDVCISYDDSLKKISYKIVRTGQSEYEKRYFEYGSNCTIPHTDGFENFTTDICIDDEYIAFTMPKSNIWSYIDYVLIKNYSWNQQYDIFMGLSPANDSCEGEDLHITEVPDEDGAYVFEASSEICYPSKDGDYSTRTYCESTATGYLIVEERWGNNCEGSIRNRTKIDTTNVECVDFSLDFYNVASPRKSMCPYKCGSYLMLDDDVCNGRGPCYPFSGCDCDYGFCGYDCEIYDCYDDDDDKGDDDDDDKGDDDDDSDSGSDDDGGDGDDSDNDEYNGCYSFIFPFAALLILSSFLI